MRSILTLKVSDRYCHLTSRRISEFMIGFWDNLKQPINTHSESREKCLPNSFTSGNSVFSTKTKPKFSSRWTLKSQPVSPTLIQKFSPLISSKRVSSKSMVQGNKDVWKLVNKPWSLKESLNTFRNAPSSQWRLPEKTMTSFRIF